MDDRLRRAIERAIGADARMAWQHAGRTGWGDAWRLSVGETRCFVKVVAAEHAAMLDAEADGLRAIAATGQLRVPGVVASGLHDAGGYLVVEWLDLSPHENGVALGRALAAMHRAKPPCGPAGARFGWHRGNFLGATPQANGWRDDWPAFFVEQRLAPQLALAARGFGNSLQRSGEQVLRRVPALLRHHEAAPSLVHGDLWSGNAATLPDGTPVVFDPAVYVGDRDVDLAMTELFGGFGAQFARAYADAWPLDDGYPLRRTIYNLYHLLNHLNLFGAAYLARVERSIAGILAAAG